MADGWFEITLTDFEANNQTLHDSVECPIKTERNRLNYSSLSRQFLKLASDLIVRGIINKQGSQIPVSALPERTYCDATQAKRPQAKEGSGHAWPQSGTQLSRAIQNGLHTPFTSFVSDRHAQSILCRIFLDAAITDTTDLGRFCFVFFLRWLVHVPARSATQTGSNEYLAGAHHIQGWASAAF